MFTLAVSRRIAVLLAFVVVAAALAIGCISEEEVNGTTEPAGEHVIDPQCLEQIGTEFPAQHPTPASPGRVSELTSILCGNETVKAHVYEYAGIRNYGETPIAMVNIYFDPPLSFAGEVPVIVTDPCRGHGVEGDLDPNDPCVDEPKEYGSAYRDFTGAQGVVAQVDFPRGEVVELFAVPVAPEEMADIRSQYEQYGQ